MVESPRLGDDRGGPAGSGYAPKSEIVIGLVNIMPPNAVKATEAQFRRLLNSGAQGFTVHLRVFTSETATAVPQHYETLEALWRTPVDGPPVDALIVTGTEPRADAMQDEPAWPQLQNICDWAALNTISTIWSCFSAHAAVLHMDGIARQRRAEKLSGVFQYRKATEHFLLQNMPAQWPVPHSRFNGLNEPELLACNYQILSHDAGLGVDSFTKHHKNSQFLFFQGHPEYHPQTLFAEFARDCRRFVSGESARMPNLPEYYFDPETSAAIEALRDNEKLLAARLAQPEFVKSVIGNLGHRWRHSAQLLVGAWLSYIAEQKSRNEAESHAYESQPGATG